MIKTSNIYRFNGKDPFTNYKLEKNGLLIGFYPRNSLINQLSSKDNGVRIYKDHLVIEDNVKTIGRSVFRNNKDYKFIVIGKNVETIEDYAFYNTKSEEFIIPASVKHIRKNSFSKDAFLIVKKGSYGERYARRNKLMFNYYK